MRDVNPQIKNLMPAYAAMYGEAKFAGIEKGVAEEVRKETRYPRRG